MLQTCPPSSPYIYIYYTHLFCLCTRHNRTHSIYNRSHTHVVAGSGETPNTLKTENRDRMKETSCTQEQFLKAKYNNMRDQRRQMCCSEEFDTVSTSSAESCAFSKERERTGLGYSSSTHRVLFLLFGFMCALHNVLEIYQS